MLDLTVYDFFTNVLLIIWRMHKQYTPGPLACIEAIGEQELKAWTKNYSGASRMLSSPHIGRWALLQWGTLAALSFFVVVVVAVAVAVVTVVIVVVVAYDWA